MSQKELFAMWMKNMQDAWESKNPQLAADLCSSHNLKYYENIFQAPITTKEEVKKIWEDVPNDQDNIHFNYEIIGTIENVNISRWNVTFYSKKNNQQFRMDGIFHVILDDQGLCTDFKQWWIIAN
jgi:hypothetical protein